MLTKEILQIKPSTIVTIVNTFGGGTRKRAETQLSDLEPNRCVNVTLVNHKRYIARYGVSNTINDFQEDGSGKGGFLVSWVSGAEVTYAVVKPVNFVATEADYHAYWQPILAQRKIDAEKREAEMELYRLRRARREEVEETRKTAVQAESERYAESVQASIATLLGQRALQQTRVRTDVNGEWINEDTEYEEYRVSQYGTVTLELRDVLRLIELALAE